MTEEKLKKYMEKGSQRKADPFKVPEGYFETLCERVMEQLPAAPQEQKRARIISFAPQVWHSVAAVAAAICLGVFVMVYEHKYSSDTTLASSDIQSIEQLSNDEQFIDDMLDYAMIDNGDIEAYLTEN